MNDLKNMLVLKDLPSNLIKEAYVVLDPKLKAKLKKIEAKNKNSSNENNKIMEKDYILEEAKYVLLNYVSKYETKTENTSNKLLEKKYKKLKKTTIFMLVIFLVYVIATNIF